MRADLLLVPGFGNAGPEHWLSHWARLYENSSRVLQTDWETPSLEAWLAPLDRAVEGGSHPALIVAHSRGCALAAHWAARRRDLGAGFGRVVGLLLVAPADVEAPEFPAFIRGDFAPLPEGFLDLPTIVAGSRNDPYCRFARAEELARIWGADFVHLGEKGHVNAISGLGEWPEGRGILERLTVRALAQAFAAAAPPSFAETAPPEALAPPPPAAKRKPARPAPTPPPAPPPEKAKRLRRAGSAQDRLADLLEARKPEAFCDDCAAVLLDFSHQAQANQAARALEKEGLFSRRTGLCARCAGTKKVTFRI